MTIKEYIQDLESRLKNMEDCYNDIKEKVDNINNIIIELKNMQFGNWEIKDKEMIFYDLAGNELAKYKLYDKAGNLTEVAIAKRVKQ